MTTRQEWDVIVNSERTLFLTQRYLIFHLMHQLRHHFLVDYHVTTSLRLLTLIFKRQNTSFGINI